MLADPGQIGAGGVGPIGSSAENSGGVSYSSQSLGGNPLSFRVAR